MSLVLLLILVPVVPEAATDFEVRLSVHTPINWKYEPVQRQAVKLGLIDPTYQGVLVPDQSLSVASGIYDVFIFAFPASHAKSLLDSLGPTPGTNGVLNVIDERDTSSGLTIRTIRTRFENVPITTILFARSGPHGSIVVVKAIVKGGSKGDRAVNYLRALIPSLRFAADGVN